MFSYWERKYFTKYDNIIIGAGLAGLFTAYNLKKKFPKESVLVLDQGMFPAASTKNAGFACMGSITELEDDLQHNSQDEVLSLFEKRYQGLQIMRETLGDENISYKENGSYELIKQHDEAIISKISDWNKRLFYIAGGNAFSVSEISQTSFSGFSSMIKNELEGEIDTGSMYKTLMHKTKNLGVEVVLNTTVSKFEKDDNGYQVLLKDGFGLIAKRLILCTNAFTSALIPEAHIAPARGQVLITKSILNLPFKGIYHFDRGYYYFREIDGRVLFGGGRQLDEKGETTSELGMSSLILEDLKKKLEEQILPNTKFEIDYTWSGIMGKSASKEPLLKQVDDSLYLLAGFGGMGVALAPYMAKELVEMLPN